MPDSYFMKKSRLNSILRNCQLHLLIQYISYTDKGFKNDTHIRAAAHGPAYVSPKRFMDNFIMSKARVTVEWDIGKISEKFPFMTAVRLMKLQQVDVHVMLEFLSY